MTHNLLNITLSTIECDTPRLLLLDSAKVIYFSDRNLIKETINNGTIFCNV